MTTFSTYFNVSQRGDSAVVELTRTDVMDADYSRQVEIEIGRLVAGLSTPKVVIDLVNVEFISSATIGMMLAVNHALESMGGALRLANVSGAIQEVFHITRLDRKIHLCDTVDNAVESMQTDSD